MVAILADDIFKLIFLIEKLRILLKFHWSFFLSVQFLIDNNPALHGLDNGLVSNRRQAIIWTRADQIDWRIYAALGGDELNDRLH